MRRLPSIAAVLAIAIAAAAAGPASASKVPAHPSVIGGAEAAPGSYGWAARIEVLSGYMSASGWGGMCSGSLIAPTYVLTAGHCTLDTGRMVADHELRVRFVTSTGYETRLVKRSATWTSYDMSGPGIAETSGSPDIGLLELADPAPAEITPVALASVDDAQRSDGLATVGFGPRELKDGEMHDRPSIADLALLPSSGCNDSPETATAREICTRPPSGNGGGTCHGDSGGALVSSLPTDAVIGVTSWGPMGSGFGDCGLQPQKRFTVFSRVDDAKDWLLKQTGESLFGEPAVAADVRQPTLGRVSSRYTTCHRRRACTRWWRVRVWASDKTGTGISMRLSNWATYRFGKGPWRQWGISRIVHFPQGRRSMLFKLKLPGALYSRNIEYQFGGGASVRVFNGLGNGSDGVAELQ